VAKYASCPQCGGANIAKVGFTWWGGALGPALLTHVKCNDCRTTYNGKTGQSNATGIIIYSVVVLVVCAVAGALLILLR
jgi:transposase-like protein